MSSWSCRICFDKTSFWSLLPHMKSTKSSPQTRWHSKNRTFPVTFVASCMSQVSILMRLILDCLVKVSCAEAEYHRILYTEWNAITIMLKTQGFLSHFQNWMHVGLLHKTMTPRLQTRFLHSQSHLVVATSVVLFSVAPLAPRPWQNMAKWCKMHCHKSSQWLVSEAMLPGTFISFHSTACRVFNCSDVSPLPGDTRTKGYFWSWMIWKEKIITWIVGSHLTNHIQQKLNLYRRC